VTLLPYISSAPCKPTSSLITKLSGLFFVLLNTESTRSYLVPDVPAALSFLIYAQYISSFAHSLLIGKKTTTRISLPMCACPFTAPKSFNPLLIRFGISPGWRVGEKGILRGSVKETQELTAHLSNTCFGDVGTPSSEVSMLPDPHTYSHHHGRLV
jgi:hypothetical protein